MDAESTRFLVTFETKKGIPCADLVLDVIQEASIFDEGALPELSAGYQGSILGPEVAAPYEYSIRATGFPAERT
jgi:hypothetical protein